MTSSISSSAFSLTRLFIAPDSVPSAPTLAQDWVGGTMLTWDAVSLANTVKVGPVVYANLPVVSPNGLTRGTVVLARTQSSYLVLGMLGSAKGVTLLDPIRYRVLPGDITLPNTTLADAGILNFLLNTNTQYGIDGQLFYNSTTSNDIQFAWNGPPNMSARWGMFGLSNASLNEILADTVTGYGDGSPQTIQGLAAPALCKPGGWFATTDTPGLLQLRTALASGTTAGTLQQGSWLRITELGQFGGANTFVKIYTATGSRSYDSSGNPIGGTDQDNNMYTWSLSGRGFGQESHMWTFPASTIRSDLAGATILSAQMYLYCFAASTTPADLTWKWSTTSTIAATMPTNGFGGAEVTGVWVPAGWGGFDISSQMPGVITGNANSVLGGSYHFADSSSGFRGYGFSASYRPYLQITFSV